jgi:hypothetical protein
MSKKLEEYIGQRVIVKAYKEGSNKLVRIGIRRYPMILKEVTKDYIKIQGTTDISYEIKKSNLYMIWSRKEKKWWQEYETRINKVIYVNEANIKKRYEEIERLNSRDYYALTLSSQILIFITFVLGLIKVILYLQPILQIIVATPPILTPLVQTVILFPFLYWIFYTGLIASILLFWLTILYWYEITHYPLLKFRKEWGTEYIELLEFKSGISVGGTNE